MNEGEKMRKRAVEDKPTWGIKELFDALKDEFLLNFQF
jgi:hypothetical protein